MDTEVKILLAALGAGITFCAYTGISTQRADKKAGLIDRCSRTDPLQIEGEITFEQIKDDYVRLNLERSDNKLETIYVDSKDYVKLLQASGKEGLTGEYVILKGMCTGLKDIEGIIRPDNVTIGTEKILHCVYQDEIYECRKDHEQINRDIRDMLSGSQKIEYEAKGYVSRETINRIGPEKPVKSNYHTKPV